MRIALVSPYDWAIPGGVNNHIAHLARQFRAKGNSVTIIAPSSQSTESSDSVTVIGRHVIGVPASGSVAHISLSFNSLRQVNELLKKDQFDIVHIHEPFMPLLPFLFLRLSPVPTIATFHAAREGGNRLYAYSRQLINPWVHKLTGRITVSRTAMRLVGKYLAGRYRIIPNGVDNKFFASSVPPLEKYRDDKKNILFLGRLEKRKGLPYLLQAYARLKKELPQIRLIIVGGDGGLRQACERYVKEQRLDDVIFAGYVPGDDLPRYYRTADIYCAPNTGAESQGIVLLEAMASGTPIIASDIEGFADVISQGKDGFLIPPRDEEALSAAMARLINDQELCSTMARQGLEKAKQYSWDLISRQVLDYYYEITGQPANAQDDQLLNVITSP